MRILAIETSCDETAIAILECKGDKNHAEFTVLGNALLSQVDIHQEYGGVFPALAKREHAKNLVPILESALEEAELLREDTQVIPDDVRAKNFDFYIEYLLLAATAGYAMVEVPITFKARVDGHSKMRIGDPMLRYLRLIAWALCGGYRVLAHNDTAPPERRP